MIDSAVADRLDAHAAAQIVLAAQSNAEAVVALTVIEGSAAGTHAVLRAGQLIGSLGDLPSALLLAAASEALASGEPAVREIGEQRVFLEPIKPTAALVIVGAGHIAVPLAEIGVLLGFAVTVLDDRDEFATAERFPAGAHVTQVDFTDAFRDVTLDANTYVVLVTRAHKYDYDCLQQLLMREQPPRYIGMIGSRRRVRAAFLALSQAGVPNDRIARVRAPVGLDIGAETPAEIAVSIAGELIRERTGRGSGEPLTEQEQVLQRFFAESDD